MSKWFAFFIDNSLLVNLLIIFLIVAGVLSLRSLPRERFPNVDMNRVVIVTRYPGASTEDVELNVTAKLEEALREVDGISEMRSVSIENSSSITLDLDESRDRAEIRRVIDDIQDAVDGVTDLPGEIDTRPEVTEIKTSDFPIIEIALSSGDREVLRRYANRLEAKLERIPLVSGVDKVGYFDREVYIEVDPRRINQAYVSLPEIIASIRKRNLRSSSGTLKSYSGLKNIVVLEKFDKPLDVCDVILRSNFDYNRIRLREVASVRLREKDEKLIVRNNGKQGISLVLRKKANADILRTIAAAKQTVRRYRDADISVTYVNDRSKMTRTRLNLLYSNGAAGLVLVLLFLVIFLNRRTALWTAFGIPFAFLASFVFFPYLDLTINNVTLAGLIIILGMIVDDAIIIAERTAFYQEQGVPGRTAALRAVKEMAAPVTAAVLTTIAAFFPIFFLGGKPGKFSGNLPTVVIIALLLSLFECFFILPNHLAHGKLKGVAKAKWVQALERGYGAVLRRVLRLRWVFLGGIVAILIPLGVVGARRLHFQLFPQSGASEFYIKIEGPRDQSLTQTRKQITELEALVEKLPASELMSYTSRAGHHSTSSRKNFGDHENWGIITVFLASYSKRERRARQIVRELRQKARGLTWSNRVNVMFEVQQVGPSGGKPVTVHLTSNDTSLLVNAERKLIGFLKTMEPLGLSNIDSDRKPGKNELVVRMNHRKMAAYGISTQDISQALRIAFDGSIVSSIQLPQEELDYRLIFDETSRRRQQTIGLIRVRNKQGRLVPISQFISFVERRSDLAVYHHNSRRSITVTAELDPERLTAMEAARHIRTRLLEKWKRPEGLHVEIAGESEDSKQVMGEMRFAIIIAFLLIFSIVSVMLKSLKQGLIIMAVIPFSLIGVLVALLSHRMNISMFVLLSLCSLIGIVVNDSIVMVNTLNTCLREAGRFTGLDGLAGAIGEAAQTRLRPILLTTLTTLGGLFPMAYGIGGYDKMLAPMALSLGWGLLFATGITLLLVPTLYVLTNQKRVTADAADRRREGK